MEYEANDLSLALHAEVDQLHTWRHLVKCRLRFCL
jgi:hypothetical protein